MLTFAHQTVASAAPRAPADGTPSHPLRRQLTELRSLRPVVVFTLPTQRGLHIWLYSIPPAMDI